MNLTLIDSSHYYLTARQAKELATGGTLPKPGYARKADPAKLAGVTLGKTIWEEVGWGKNLERKSRFVAFPNAPKGAEILRTPLSWFAGKPVENGWVWALFVHRTN